MIYFYNFRKQHVYNNVPFRQNPTLVVNSHSNLLYRYC